MASGRKGDSDEGDGGGDEGVRRGNAKRKTNGGIFAPKTEWVILNANS